MGGAACSNALGARRLALAELISIPGYPPSLLEHPQGCIFRERCPFADGRCAEEKPALLPVAEAHFAACHQKERVDELRALGSRKETWAQMGKSHAG